ncbi:SMP-30/gluconolactonase/LRE family protein [Carboxylicivirga sp. M1479]|uniref:SMP-30/gluconolactonase/LRE family protein n=1 Tax=Carboxylicivirga sp. M1479 TaxID=2594476 RepID=UPI001C8F3A1E|nr:SMP-30/gluconolactonase/LRE family protein [Carboxylicivirga sp. M1479]
MNAELFIPDKNILGEGPLWDAHRKELLWVDIERQLLCFCKVVSGDIETIRFDSKISSVVPVKDTNDYLLALQYGLKFYNRTTGKTTPIAHPESDIQNNRFNDGKCDPNGRYWVGTMDLNAESEKGSLYCFDEQQQLTKKLSRLTISNGLAWDLDKKSFYFIDTVTYKVVRYLYNENTGDISNQQTVVNVPKNHGAPDGMCIDSEGMLWIAHWGGANVSRWNPMNGKLIQKVEVPSLNVTSCCFGDTDLKTLYITSARIGLNEPQLKKYPLSGSIFKIRTDVKGVSTDFYKLDLK